MVGIEVRGMAAALAFLTVKKKEIKEAEEDGIRKATLFVHGEVKSSIAGQRDEPTSVDTGQFLNSVQFEIKEDSSVVFSEVEHAKFLEFGTTSMNPRRHFANTKARTTNKVKDIIEKEIKKV